MRMITLSASLLAAGLFAATLPASSASAQSASNYPWCLMTGPAQSCFYTSMAQCMASRRGAVDFCEPNNTYVGNSYSRSYGYRASQ
jgi:ABC-type sugar transport system substrate-binding protein